jgi:hypothetical protein
MKKFQPDCFPAEVYDIFVRWRQHYISFCLHRNFLVKQFQCKKPTSPQLLPATKFPRHQKNFMARHKGKNTPAVYKVH